MLVKIWNSHQGEQKRDWTGQEKWFDSGDERLESCQPTAWALDKKDLLSKNIRVLTSFSMITNSRLATCELIVLCFKTVFINLIYQWSILAVFSLSLLKINLYHYHDIWLQIRCFIKILPLAPLSWLLGGPSQLFYSIVGYFFMIL